MLESRTGSASTPFQTPPLRAEVWKKKLDPIEKLILLAMLEGNSSGQFNYVGLKRIAAYCGASRSTVQRVINGEEEKKFPSGRIRPHRPGFLERRYLAIVAPHSSIKREPTTYRIQIDAIPDDPEVLKYFSRQQKFPFAAEPHQVEKWIHHNEGKVKAIVDHIRLVTLQPGAKLSDPDRIRKAVAIAEDHGMPQPIALAMFRDGRGAK